VDERRQLTDLDIRLHALNLAVAQRREVFRVSRKRDDEPDDGGWLAEETLHDARLYADWLANGDQRIETPEQSAAVVAANLDRMGVTLGGEP
jgi:hypothetical protein